MQGMSAGYESRFGYYMTTTGVVRLLVVLVEFDYADPNDDPTGMTGTSQWPAHELPEWVVNSDPSKNLFDSDVPLGTASGLVTRYYQEASSGAFIVVADYLLAPDNGGVFHMPTVSGAASYPDVAAAVDAATGGVRTTLNGYDSIDDLDLWSIGGTGTGSGEQKTTPSSESPRLYDHVAFIYRNATSPGNRSGNAHPGTPGSICGYGANTWTQQTAYGEVPLDVMRHEFGHLLFGDNTFHCAGGGGYNTQYWITQSGGWGCMGLSNASLNTWNAWDRQRMAWKFPGQVNEIAARNALNTAEVNGDLDPTDPGDAGIYVLRDFVATGDALRIKLPFTDIANEYPEFIWVENHQGRSSNADPFDRWQYEDAPCVVDLTPGLQMYLQIDRDVRTSTSQSDIYFSGHEDYLRPLIASGHYDMGYPPTPAPNTCVGGGQEIPFVRELPNPLTGCGDTHWRARDENADDLIQQTVDMLLNTTEDVAGVLNYNLFSLGHARHGFTLVGNPKLGVGTNPSSASMMNSLGRNTNASPNKNLRKVYLNGISIQILQQLPDGSIKVQVRFDDVDVNNDARWCADEIQLNPVPTSTGYSLNVTSGNTITLDQGRTATRRNSPITLADGTKVFCSPTLMRCPVYTWLNLAPNSGFVVDNNSTLRLEPGSRLTVGDGAVLRVKRGGKLELMGGSTLTIAAGGKVIIEEDVVNGNDGSLIYHPDARINLDASTSELEIAGQLVIKQLATFTAGRTADANAAYGKVRFSNTDVPSTNITAEGLTKFIMRSDNLARRVLYVDQESLYGPSNLIEFSVLNCTATLAPGARIVPPVTNNCAIKFIGSRVTSPNSSRNTHRRVRLNGQSQVTLSGSTFSNGSYGLYAYNPTLGGNLPASTCTFSNCDYGAYVYGKGLTVTDCHFNSCTTAGLNAEQMSYSSSITHCSAAGNGIGVYFQGSARLTVYDPAFDGNGTGLQLNQTDASVACGSISNNLAAGIQVDFGAILRMTGPVSPPHEPVTVVNNPYSIRCKKAYNCYLNNGYNSLRPVTPGIQRSLNGTFICQTIVSQAAYHNNWNGTTAPLSSSDYNITTACTPPGNIPFVDPYSATETLCGQAIPPCPNPPCHTPPDALAYCPTCEYITTDEFGTVRLDQASAMAQGLSESAAPENEKQALQGFEEILMSDLTSVNDQESWLLAYDYGKMKESLSDAFAKSEVTVDEPAMEVDEYVSPMQAVQDKKIAEALASNNYDVQLFTNLDKVAVLRAAGRLDDALSLIGDVVTWAGPDELDLVSRIQCQTSIERDVVNGLMDWSAVEDAMALCIAGNVRSLTTANGTTEPGPAGQLVGIIPNPTDRAAKVIGVPARTCELHLMDVFGRQMLHVYFVGSADLHLDHLSAGVYTYWIEVEGDRVHSDRLVITR